MGISPSAPAVAWQPSLWADDGTAVDVSFRGLERTQLDADSWVDHCPGWMSGSDQAFEELLRDVAWSQRRRRMYDREVDEPRLTSWQKIGEQTAVASRWLEDARASLSEHYGVRFDSVGLNLYRDGADSVAWHRDRIPPKSWIPSWPSCRSARHARSCCAPTVVVGHARASWVGATFSSPAARRSAASSTASRR
jgi:hypothetical protein